MSKHLCNRRVGRGQEGDIENVKRYAENVKATLVRTWMAMRNMLLEP